MRQLTALCYSRYADDVALDVLHKKVLGITYGISTELLGKAYASQVEHMKEDIIFNLKETTNGY